MESRTKIDMGVEMEKKLSPEAQRDFDEFVRSIPDYFNNSDYMDVIGAKITNDGKSRIDHENVIERGTAFAQKWAEDSILEGWLTAHDTRQ
jgi:hypothetical protein